MAEIEMEPEEAKVTFETWEVTIPGAVWVYRYDKRNRSYAQVKVGGPSGPKRVRITADDREYTQEQIIDENKSMDPFLNGMLVKIVKGKRVGPGLSDEDIREYLVEDIEQFEELVRAIDSEIVIRRLRDVVEEHGTVRQFELVREVIEEKWKVGGTQRTVREMIEAGERVGGEVLG